MRAQKSQWVVITGDNVCAGCEQVMQCGVPFPLFGSDVNFARGIKHYYSKSNEKEK